MWAAFHVPNNPPEIRKQPHCPLLHRQHIGETNVNKNMFECFFTFLHIKVTTQYNNQHLLQLPMAILSFFAFQVLDDISVVHNITYPFSSFSD